MRTNSTLRPTKRNPSTTSAGNAKICITVPPEYLEPIDKQAYEEGLSRNSIILRALKYYLKP